MNQILQEFVTLGSESKAAPRKDEQDRKSNKDSAIANKATINNGSPAKFLSALERIPKVAIAEDMSSLAELYRITLTRAGYNVLKLFPNGAELVDYLSLLDAKSPSDERIPDVVILDYRMPILDGVETAKILRANFPRLKIIMVSAYELPKEATGYFDAYLNKPVTGTKLTSALSGVLGN
jgi:CheY-like chemotaxis protein